MKKRNVKNTGEVIRNIISVGYPGDLDFCRVDLTRGADGQYYLNCEGGARSAFRVYRGYPDDSWTGGAVVYRVESDDDKRRVNRGGYFVFGEVGENIRDVIDIINKREGKHLAN